MGPPIMLGPWGPSEARKVLGLGVGFRVRVKGLGLEFRVRVRVGLGSLGSHGSPNYDGSPGPQRGKG